MSTIETITAELRDHDAKLAAQADEAARMAAEVCARVQTERARVALALDALVPQRASAAKARKAKARKAAKA